MSKEEFISEMSWALVHHQQGEENYLDYRKDTRFFEF